MVLKTSNQTLISKTYFFINKLPINILYESKAREMFLLNLLLVFVKHKCPPVTRQVFFKKNLTYFSNISRTPLHSITWYKRIVLQFSLAQSGYFMSPVKLNCDLVSPRDRNAQCYSKRFVSLLFIKNYLH